MFNKKLLLLFWHSGTDPWPNLYTFRSDMEESDCLYSIFYLHICRESVTSSKLINMWPSKCIQIKKQKCIYRLDVVTEQCDNAQSSTACMEDQKKSLSGSINEGDHQGPSGTGTSVAMDFPSLTHINGTSKGPQWWTGVIKRF